MLARPFALALVVAAIFVYAAWAHEHARAAPEASAAPQASAEDVPAHALAPAPVHVGAQASAASEDFFLGHAEPKLEKKEKHGEKKGHGKRGHED